MTALRFQTGRGHQTSPASLRGQTERQRQRETEAHSSQNKQTSDTDFKKRRKKEELIMKCQITEFVGDIFFYIS